MNIQCITVNQKVLEISLPHKGLYIISALVYKFFGGNFSAMIPLSLGLRVKNNKVGKLPPQKKLQQNFDVMK